jgi:hypothetical protein
MYPRADRWGETEVRKKDVCCVAYGSSRVPWCYWIVRWPPPWTLCSRHHLHDNDVEAQRETSPTWCYECSFGTPCLNLFTTNFRILGSNTICTSTELLRAFEKLQAATVSFMPVCPSVRIEKLGSHWTDFQEIWYLKIFVKTFRENSKFD